VTWEVGRREVCEASIFNEGAKDHISFKLLSGGILGKGGKRGARGKKVTGGGYHHWGGAEEGRTTRWCRGGSVGR